MVENIDGRVFRLARNLPVIVWFYIVCLLKK